MNWRIATLDHLILRALERGFKDQDFQGWQEQDGETRIQVVGLILHHGGLPALIFRKGFADAVFVGGPPLREDNGLPNYPEVTPKMKTLGDYYRVQLLFESDMLLYLRKNRHVWDVVADQPGIEL